MRTELGLIIHDLRVERGESLRDQANNLGLTPAFLSALEFGRSSMCVEEFDQFMNRLELPATVRNSMVKAAMTSRSLDSGVNSESDFYFYRYLAGEE